MDLFINIDLNFQDMRKTFLLLFVALGVTFTSCSTHKEFISQTPKTHREAIVYDDYVVVVTRTTITREHYDRLVANTRQNREGVNNK